MSLVVIKSKKLPEGTIRKYGKYNYKKIHGKWIRVKIQKKEDKNEKDEFIIDNTRWNNRSLQYLSNWVEGETLEHVRYYVNQIVTEGKVSSYVEEVIGKEANGLLDRVRSLDNVNVLYRGTKELSWLKAKKGDKVVFGLGSFSKSSKHAKRFGEVIIKFKKDSNEIRGIDVDNISRNKDFYEYAIKKGLPAGIFEEREVIVRSNYLEVVDVNKKEKVVTVIGR